MPHMTLTDDLDWLASSFTFYRFTVSERMWKTYFTLVLESVELE
jgi:hypothetical protein